MSWKKDENEPWTPNQKAEVVRETGMQRKWLHMFGWTHGEAYYNISGFRRAEISHFDEMSYGEYVNPENLDVG